MKYTLLHQEDIVQELNFSNRAFVERQTVAPIPFDEPEFSILRDFPRKLREVHKERLALVGRSFLFPQASPRHEHYIQVQDQPL